MQRIGIKFSDRPHVRDYVRLGRLVEDLSYDSLWVTEPRMARDAITVIAALAVSTSRITLGTSVINTWTRGPGLTAVTFATLNELAPGRVVLGIGAYWEPLALNQGIVRRKPLTAMREYIDVVRRLWRFERVTYEGEVVKVRDLELDAAHAAELAYEKGDSPKPIDIPIYIGASGDRMLELAGEIADGVILSSPFSCDFVRRAVQRIKAGADRAGRDVSKVVIHKGIYVSVDRGRGDEWAIVKRKIARYLGQQEHVAKASGLSEEELSRIREAMGGWPPRPGGVEDAMKLVPDSLVRSLVAFGPPDECRERVKEMVVAGVTHPVLLTEQDDAEELIEHFAPETWG